MRNKTNPAVIGGFIVGAVCLVVIGVLLFGSGKFFQKTIACVLYFEGDVQGLSVGASVKFRGVKIGEVTSITTRLDPTSLEVKIPVYVDLTAPGAYFKTSASADEQGDPIKKLVEHGLRGQLQSESLVTGQLFVQLDFYSDVPLPDSPRIDAVTGRREIPTVPTVLQKAQTTVRQVLEKLEKLPLENMLAALQGTLSGANRLLNSPELQHLPAQFSATLEDVHTLATRTDQQMTPLLVSLDRITHALEPVVATAGRTLGTFDKLAAGDGARLVADLDHAAREAEAALAQTKQTMASLESVTRPTSATGHELRDVLQELAGAARAVHALADALENQPNAVIFGKRLESQK